MAVSTIEPLPKSQPDMSKLNTFTGHTVTVTKHVAPRNSTGQMVVPTQQMKLTQILELMTSTPMQYGPGYYRFTVSDTGGTGDDVWLVKLGPDFQEAPQMANVTPIGPGQQPPAGEGVVHLGHGFYYNADLGTLTTPWRTVHNWKQGDPIPTQPTSSSVQTPAATPWWQNLPQQQPGGWGGFPVGGSDDRVKQLEQQIADQTRRQEQADLRAEMRRVEENAQKRADEQAARFEKLIEKLTSKPAGPSEAEQRLERELAEQRRRIEEREREDRLRAEIKAQQDNTDRLLREMNTNKTDPMIPLLMQVMTAASSQAQETVKAIQSSTQATAAASERGTQELVRQLSASVMSPLQLVQLIQSSKGEGAEMGRMVIDATKETMSMQKEVYQQLLDVAGSSGQPAWVGLVQEAMSKIGDVGAALAARGQQPAPMMMPPPPQRQMVQQMPQQRQAAAPQIAPQPVQHGPMTPAALREQAAAQVPHLVPTQAPAMHAAPMAGPMNGATAPAQAAPPPVEVIPPAKAARKPTRRKSRKSQEPAPPADPKGYTIEEMRVQDPDEVRAVIAPFSDEQVFGGLYQYVLQLRSSQLPPDTVAAYILQAREAAVQQGMITPAIELLLSEQLDVLVERLFPEAPKGYHVAVVQAMATAISAKDGDEDEDEEDETEA
jgi:hypothetical protein